MWLKTARSMFAGTYTALVTPFQNDRVDEAAFTRLIEGQIAAGIDLIRIDGFGIRECLEA